MTNLAKIAWWKAAALRGLYTALAIALPYLGGALIADIQWLTILRPPRSASSRRS